MQATFRNKYNCSRFLELSVSGCKMMLSIRNDPDDVSLLTTLLNV